MLNKLRSIKVPFPERCGTFFSFFRDRQNYKKYFSVLLCLVFIAGCSTGKASLTASLPGEREIITDYPEGCSQYKWIHHVPESTDQELYFVGVSDKHAAEADARNQALINCMEQFALQCKVKIKLYYNYLAVSFGKSSKVTDPSVAIKDSRQHIVEAFISRVKPQKFCTQRIISGTSELESFWKVYTLATVPVDEVERVQKYKPPPPLSINVIKMGDNRCCIEVKSYLGVPVENFKLFENGRKIFPNELCANSSEEYRITGHTATLDFSNRRSVFLGGKESTFNFNLSGAGKITAYYSMNNRPDSVSQQY